jgi:hypothetical protein
MSRHRHPSGPLYVVRLRAAGPNPIHGLRWLLKIALRRGFRCVSVEEITDPEKGPDDARDKTKSDLAH